MTQIIKNFTPHDVTIVDSNNNLVATFKPEGLVRLSTKTVSDSPIGIIPTTKTEFGQPDGLPDFVEGVFYIVSQLVKNALPNRTDLLVPSEVVRLTEDKLDDNGNILLSKGTIIGCKSLGR